MSAEMLFTHALILAAIRPTADFFNWTQNMASQAEITIKIVASVIILGAAVILAIKTKFRIGSLMGILAGMALAYWLILGGGFAFGGETVKDTVNAGMISMHFIRF
ncbi:MULTISPECIES: hypothetical protein [unclassified Leucobacter]|uniref:hypothetical protein n=1 Tax=unclassified Leucobacter TaxID=2621730 RepID=UPI00301867AB